MFAELTVACPRFRLLKFHRRLGVTVRELGASESKIRCTFPVRSEPGASSGTGERGRRTPSREAQCGGGRGDGGVPGAFRAGLLRNRPGARGWARRCPTDASSLECFARPVVELPEEASPDRRHHSCPVETPPVPGETAQPCVWRSRACVKPTRTDKEYRFSVAPETRAFSLRFAPDALLRQVAGECL